MISWLSVDKIMRARYMNYSSNLRGLTSNEEMTFYLKHLNFVLLNFTRKRMSLIACTKICNGDLIGAVVDTRSIRSST